MPGAVVDDDAARLDRILGLVDPDDAVWLVERLGRLEPRCSRVRRRDHAVRAVAAKFYGGKPTCAARALAAALEAYHGATWLVKRHIAVLDVPDERQRLLHEILRMNGGKPLGWQTIYNIFKE